ncbi:MAG: hypothetical protein HUU32_21865 [Calditrichaceae bacterium]|nr:hypothetical protein [Calditrichaceae bacterium]
MEKRQTARQSGKLRGVVIAVEDNIYLKNRRVTCASRMLDHFISP